MEDRAVLAGGGQAPSRATEGASSADRGVPAFRRSRATAEIRVRGAAVGRCGSVHTRHDRLRRGERAHSDVHRRSALDSGRATQADGVAPSIAARAIVLATVTEASFLALGTQGGSRTDLAGRGGRARAGRQAARSVGSWMRLLLVVTP